MLFSASNAAASAAAAPPDLCRRGDLRVADDGAAAAAAGAGDAAPAAEECLRPGERRGDGAARPPRTEARRGEGAPAGRLALPGAEKPFSHAPAPPLQPVPAVAAPDALLTFSWSSAASPEPSRPFKKACSAEGLAVRRSLDSRRGRADRDGAPFSSSESSRSSPAIGGRKAPILSRWRVLLRPAARFPSPADSSSGSTIMEMRRPRSFVPGLVALQRSKIRWGRCGGWGVRAMFRWGSSAEGVRTRFGTFLLTKKDPLSSSLVGLHDQRSGVSAVTARASCGRC